MYPNEGAELWIAALLSSNLATAVARFRGEAFWQPKFQNSMVSAIPFLEPQSNADVQSATAVISAVRARMYNRPQYRHRPRPRKGVLG